MMYILNIENVIAKMTERSYGSYIWKLLLVNRLC